MNLPCSQKVFRPTSAVSYYTTTSLCYFLGAAIFKKEELDDLLVPVNRIGKKKTKPKLLNIAFTALTISLVVSTLTLCDAIITV